jgi:hypothetical protein
MGILSGGSHKSQSSTPRAIGGEFELCSLPQPIVPVELTQGISGSWTVSGRAALYALLRPLKKQGIKKILLPAYLCESVLQPVRACGLDYEYYPVDENLVAHPDPPKGSAVLLIHYFGWLNPSTKALRDDAGDLFILIEDMTQAVFSSWNLMKGGQSLLFFSLRKLGPVPLGGWFSRVEKLPPADPMYIGLFWKSVAARLYKFNYLRIKTEVDVRAEHIYLELFQAVESSFDRSCVAYALDDKARDLIFGIDWANAAAIRRNNWNHLHVNLEDLLMPFHEDLADGVVPLGYVVHCSEREKLRRGLQNARIFCPVHWPLPEDLDARRFPISTMLSNSLMTIPIDQRNGPEDMEYIAQTVRQIGLC